MSRQFNHKLCISFTILMAVLFSAIASFAETIDYGYDNVHRLTDVEYSDDTTVEYTYDHADNRLQESTSPSGLTYTVSGQVAKDSVGIGGVLVTLTSSFTPPRLFI